MWARGRHFVLGLVAAVALLGSPLAKAQSVHLTVSIHGPLRRVPSSFLGISLEASELTKWERWSTSFGRMLDLLRAGGNQPRVILRVGGESAENAFWSNNWQQDILASSVETFELTRWVQWSAFFGRVRDLLRPGGHQSPVTGRARDESADNAFWRNNRQQDVRPAYHQDHPYIVDQSWMNGLASLVRAAHLKVLLELNLAAHSPKMAANEASSARGILPRGSLSAFEVGDEPDLYAHGLVGMTRAGRSGPNQWAFSFSPSDYDRWFARYAAAVRRVVPGAHVAGPSVTDGSDTWAASLIRSQPHAVSLVTSHLYPLFDGCPPPGNPPPPHASGYLNDAAAAGTVRKEESILSDARRAHLPVSVDEAGSGACGGHEGQSNTFATSLWAPDFVFNVLAAGAASMNVHLRANGYPNTAIQYTDSGLAAEPFFYGLAIVARTLGPGAKLMSSTRTGGPNLLKVWPVLLSDGVLRVLYINKSRANATVTLNWASRRPASLQRLTAASLLSEDTVRLAGQWLGPDGRWQGTRRVGRVPAHHHTYRVSLPALSAAVLSIPG